MTTGSPVKLAVTELANVTDYDEFQSRHCKPASKRGFHFSVDTSLAVPVSLESDGRVLRLAESIVLNGMFLKAGCMVDPICEVVAIEPTQYQKFCVAWLAVRTTLIGVAVSSAVTNAAPGTEYLADDLLIAGGDPVSKYSIHSTTHKWWAKYAMTKAQLARSSRRQIGGVTAETRVDTPVGPVPVGILKPGVKVRNAEGEFRPLESLRISNGATGLVRIPEGVLDASGPVYMTPEQAVLIRGTRPMVRLGLPEVLVRARQLIGYKDIALVSRDDSAQLYHLGFPNAEIYCAEGLLLSAPDSGAEIDEIDPRDKPALFGSRKVSTPTCTRSQSRQLFGVRRAEKDVRLHS
ncbi:Hint domain-containing protein [Pseudoruegeria sp. HB172150]|uniref:Hint domain-containing protein n=1 Tax=Pseudoruegeria sp. HB172150 TaxID=2721164 RepID=UPI0015554DEF|nr:Hint domain-containing protein [Pseudoruegeria sp. HB172150]